jgi:hypothetical protein
MKYKLYANAIGIESNMTNGKFYYPKTYMVLEGGGDNIADSVFKLPAPYPFTALGGHGLVCEITVNVKRIKKK